jgi:hypothetical protein
MRFLAAWILGTSLDKPEDDNAGLFGTEELETGRPGAAPPRALPVYPPRIFANALVDKAIPCQAVAFWLGSTEGSVSNIAPGTVAAPGTVTIGMNVRSRRRACGGWNARRACTSQ